jgi:hypothetical protein
MAKFNLGTALAGNSSSESLEVRLFRITCLIMFVWTIYDLIQIPLLTSPYKLTLELS